MKVKICHHSTVYESLAGGSNATVDHHYITLPYLLKGPFFTWVFSTVGTFYEEWLEFIFIMLHLNYTQCSIHLFLSCCSLYCK